MLSVGAQSVLKFAKKGGIGEVGGFRHVRGAFTAYEWVWSSYELSKLIKESLAQVRSSQQ